MSLKILVIGTGQMGALHYKNLCRLRDKYDIHVLSTNSSNDLKSILTSKRIDACVVALPYHLHYEVVSTLLEKNIHCFVEKPISMNYEMAKKLVSIAERKKLILMVGHILRFSQTFGILKDLIQQNAIGTPTMINCRRFTLKTIKNWWKNLNRFLLLYEGIHTIDILIDTLGEIPQYINCRMNYTHPGIRGESEFIVNLEFKSGIISVIHHDMKSPYNINEIYISGTEGKILIKDFSKIYLNGDIIYNSNFNEMMTHSSYNEMNCFLRAITGKEPPKSSGKDILPSMKVIEMCYYSASNKVRVEIEGRNV
ncbi:MAG TPA: Gfo/Idh/MocA family oxidoreductase [Thermoprotei archaeon]|nr:Gfo/Idh/MocA family oxidoreductase [Thermoprotei archaeon]